MRLIISRTKLAPMIKRILYILLLVFAIAGSGWGATYYAYPTTCSTGSGDGSYGSPWTGMATINAYSFSAGDDLYFENSTNLTLTSNACILTVDWSGVDSNNPAIIGCYDNGDSDVDDCTITPLVDGGRPTFNGSANTYPSGYQGLIDIQNASVSYVTVQDLKLEYSGRYGVGVKYSDNINVDNCYIYRSNKNCILYASGGGDGVNTGTISENYCENAGYPDYDGSGAAIEISGGDSAGSTTNILVTGNNVNNGKHEGIGAYKKATYVTIEKNVVRDMRSFHIYLGESMYCTARYNLVYESTDKAHATFTENEVGIEINNESARAYTYSGNHEIYGNMVAGMTRGIVLACQIQEYDPPNNADFPCLKATKIYNNTLVDNDYNFYFWAESTQDTAEIKNNVSFHTTSTGGQVHTAGAVDGDSPDGVTASHNLYNTIDDAVPGGTMGTNAVTKTGAQDLHQTTTFFGQAGGSFEGDEFSFDVGGSGIDVGTSISSYNDRISAADYTATPITVTTSDDSSDPDIGAWMYGEAEPSGDGSSLTSGSLTSGSIN